MTVYSSPKIELESFLRPHLKKPFVFLETASFDKENETSFLFSDFEEILVFNHNDNPDKFFKRAEAALKKGFWLCGCLSYEFGYHLEPALYSLREKTSLPLAWLGICKKPLIIKREFYRTFPKDKVSSYTLTNIRPNISRKEYYSGIKNIKGFIEKGLTYETNFTFKIKFDFKGDTLGLYLDLRNAQPTSYMAMVNTERERIISFSPELFFRRRGDQIITRPMKGTISRGVSVEDDKDKLRELKESVKIKAENLMITDLLRNDIGRFCERVSAPDIFNTERHRTLYQMTSTVEGKLKGRFELKEAFSALFPSGSVTGAPKIKTMEIIKRIEKEPRGIYTGAIGFISPLKKSCFNVAIRTVIIKDGKGELGIGGGIVYDSSPANEYEEALLKGRFLTKGLAHFSLIETMLWEEKKGYFLSELHLKRLKDSCAYFSIPLDIAGLKSKLKALEKDMKVGRWKVRLLAGLDGWLETQKFLLKGDFNPPVRIRISRKRINPRDIFLYHKTTNRELYDNERKVACGEGFFDVLFMNEDKQITEGAITNIFALKKKKLYTPPVACGLLGGVLREMLITSGRAKEKILYLEDIKDADKLYVGNSVMGLLEAELS